MKRAKDVLMLRNAGETARPKNSIRAIIKGTSGTGHSSLYKERKHRRGPVNDTNTGHKGEALTDNAGAQTGWVRLVLRNGSASAMPALMTTATIVPYAYTGSAERARMVFGEDPVIISPFYICAVPCEMSVNKCLSTLIYCYSFADQICRQS